ncbi:MAG: hypothetical protein R3A78_08145 [Polyangiales bacterium]
MLLTTHYMDEAERCHRLAFIFRGTLLDIGTPQQIVERRHLRAAELEVDDSPRAAAILREAREVDEVAHYGHLLRVATRDVEDPASFLRDRLTAAGIHVENAHSTRVTVEDAFVSMVRSDAADATPGAEVAA